MANIPTQEDLKNLSPAERIKVLKQNEEVRKRELEETKKQVEQELAATEELIKEVEDESAEADAQSEKKDRDAQEKARKDEESLEERLAGERTRKPTEEETQRSYDPAKANVYNTLERDVSELDRLYRIKTWSPEDANIYREAKGHIDAVQQYKIDSDRLAEELGFASDALSRLKYRR